MYPYDKVCVLFHERQNTLPISLFHCFLISDASFYHFFAGNYEGPAGPARYRVATDAKFDIGIKARNSQSLRAVLIHEHIFFCQLGDPSCPSLGELVI
jgi:hypothetical protein